jgi:hypothetical protein
LPEALARSNIDLIIADEKPARAPRGPAKPRAPSASRAPAVKARPKSRWRVRLGRRPLRTASGAIFGALLMGIFVNAVALQKGRHPAPLFAERQPAPSRPAPRPAESPAPIAAHALAPPPVARAPVPVADPSPPAPVDRPAKREAPKESDPLGALIARESTGVGEAERVYAIQQALRRLGFGVRANSRWDAPTKAALLKFEKEFGLPPSAEANPHVLRVLAAKSGVRVR